MVDMLVQVTLILSMFGPTIHHKQQSARETWSYEMQKLTPNDLDL